MAKYLKKKEKKKPKAWRIVLLVVLVIALAAFAVFVMPRLLYSLSGGGEDTTPEQTDTRSALSGTDAPEPTLEPSVSTVQFPLSVDNGRLEIGSLFQFSGINPDCGNREGTDVAAIELKNVSDTYLAEAKLLLTLADGVRLNFLVRDLPAGKSVMAFSTENLSLPADAACQEARCEAVYDAAAQAEYPGLSVSAAGTLVTLTNTSGEDLFEIVVYCRSTLGEDSFGGITYQYTVNNLPAGESTAVDAVDCILGMAEVVRIAVNDEE